MSDSVQWATHGIKPDRFRVSQRAALRLFMFVVVLTLVAALYLVVVSRIAARGRHIGQLQTELFRLQRESEQLEVEIAAEGSVWRLMERAAELGFVPAQGVQFSLLTGE